MNGWLRDFFKNNAWSIMLAIVSLIGVVFVMRRDVASVVAASASIPSMQSKQAVQEEINRGWERYMLESNRRLDKIELKLDKILERK